MATREDIAKIVMMLSAAYPNWSITEYTVEVYFQDLQDIPTEELILAARHCRTENGRKFAPSTGEIRGAVAELRGYASNMPSSFQAWEEVMRQIVVNGGDYGKPEWSHSLVETAVRRIGWRELRMSENQAADRARFIQCYEQLQERASKDEMLLPDVRCYLEVHGALIEAPMTQIKRLADRMDVKK